MSSRNGPAVKDRADDRERPDAVAEAVADARATGIRFVQLQFTDIIGPRQGGHDPDPPARGLRPARDVVRRLARSRASRGSPSSDQYLDARHDDVRRDPVAAARRARAGRPASSATSSRRAASRSSATRATCCGARSSAPGSWATSSTPARSWSSSCSGAAEDGSIAPLPHDSGRLLRLLDRPRPGGPPGHGRRPRGVRDQGRGGPPRGRGRPARDRLRVRRRAATADNAVTFKFALKAIAQQHGLYATFMPKPIHGINGSGMHTHQSLWSIAEGRNAFADATNPYGLSDVARSYMAGHPRPRPRDDRRSSPRW